MKLADESKKQFFEVKHFIIINRLVVTTSCSFYSAFSNKTEVICHCSFFKSFEQLEI